MYGPLWETDHKAYGKMRKVEPMQRALDELGATALLTGLRSSQTAHRKNMRRVNMQRGSYKLCPVLHWSDEDVHAYFVANNLLYHPLKEQGYESVGDAHSSAPVAADGDVRSSRFGGKHQECGLHVDDDEAAECAKIGRSAHVNNAKFGTGVEIYSKTSCKSCIAAKALFRAQRLQYTEYILGVDVDRSTLEERTGTKVSSVPQIFIDGQRVGGLAELQMHLNRPKGFGRKGAAAPSTPNTGTGLAQAQSAEQWLASIFDQGGNESNGLVQPESNAGSYVGPPISPKGANHALQTFTAESWMRKVFACT